MFVLLVKAVILSVDILPQKNKKILVKVHVGKGYLL